MTSLANNVWFSCKLVASVKDPSSRVCWTFISSISHEKFVYVKPYPNGYWTTASYPRLFLPKVSYDENGNADYSRRYLSLSSRETIMLRKVTNKFNNVIVLVNSSAPMELGFVDYYKIGACLYIGYPGYYGTESIAKSLPFVKAFCVCSSIITLLLLKNVSIIPP